MPDPAVPATPKLPSIPTPIKGNADSVHDVLMAMKQALEMMMGTVGKEPTTRTFLQNEAPTAVVAGDQWIVLDSGVMRYWNGEDWLFIRPAPP